jgi:hypothetical protein
LAQVLETRDPETFAEALAHPDWDTTMNEEYCSLMENNTWACMSSKSKKTC